MEENIGNMDEATRLHFSRIQAYYLDCIKGYVSEYDTSITYKDVAKISYESFKGTDLERDFPPAFSMEIISFSPRNNKALIFSISDGTNTRHNHYNRSHFTIRRTKDLEPDSLKFAKRFGLKDYFTFKGIDIEVNSWHIVEDIEIALRAAKLFIDNITILLKKDDIQQMLNSTDWLDVPLDKSPYF